MKFDTYYKLKDWKDALDDGSKDNDIITGKITLTDAIRARIYIRRVGSNYK